MAFQLKDIHLGGQRTGDQEPAVCSDSGVAMSVLEDVFRSENICGTIAQLIIRSDDWLIIYRKAQVSSLN